MYDIKDYIEERLSNDDGFVPDSAIDDIERDISEDINGVLTRRAGGLFRSDKFKCGSQSIEIFHPSLSFNDSGNYLYNPDYIRFLLSLYPEKEDLENTDAIIIQPRHIEIDGIELAALYFRSAKILVLYMHSPFLHPLEYGSFDDYSFLPHFFRRYVPGDSVWGACVDTKGNMSRIPLLWHLFSVIRFSPDNMIDKFFISNKNEGSAAVRARLENISLFYSRHGY